MPFWHFFQFLYRENRQNGVFFILFYEKNAVSAFFFNPFMKKIAKTAFFHIILWKMPFWHFFQFLYKKNH
jgi:hypothetical protein